MRNLIASITMSMALIVSTPVVAQTPDTLSRDELAEFILETIRQNPEVIAEAIGTLQRRESEARAAQGRAAFADMRDLIERDSNAPVLGNPDGDVTVVEFFDYNCPYCKRVANSVKGLVESDPGVRVVYREWPILGEDSLFAARAALAAREQQKYEDMHNALMSGRRANEESVMTAARDLGLDIDKLRSDMASSKVEEHIQLSMQITQALGFTGTPSFVIGDELVPGAVSFEQLQQLVEAARGRD